MLPIFRFPLVTVVSPGQALVYAWSDEPGLGDGFPPDA